jgi:type IX secretion system PorP/SprF family membrane protein
MNKIIKTLLLLLIPVSLSGQLVPVTNQYVLNPITINPAYAGSRGALNVAASYRKQWIGVKGAPETVTIFADAPMFDNKIGLGLIVSSDKVGVTRETQIITNYAYKIKMPKGSLMFGLGAGFFTTNTSWSDLIVLDQGDEFYLINSRPYFIPSFSFGTYYSYNNYFAGFSIPKIFGNRFNFDKNRYNLSIDPSQYMIYTGYKFVINPKLKLFPSTLLTYTPKEKILFDLNAHVCYLDRFWMGISYRNKRSFTGLFQFQVNEQLRVAYSYDFDIGSIGRYSSGSHEIMLRYEFRYKVDIVNPLIF